MWTTERGHRPRGFHEDHATAYRPQRSRGRGKGVEEMGKERKEEGEDREITLKCTNLALQRGPGWMGATTDDDNDDDDDDDDGGWTEQKKLVHILVQYYIKACEVFLTNREMSVLRLCIMACPRRLWSVLQLSVACIFFNISRPHCPNSTKS